MRGVPVGFAIVLTCLAALGPADAATRTGAGIGAGGLPNHPPAAGACKSNPLVLRRCTDLWNQCVSVRHRGDPCPGEWRHCCSPVNRP